MRQIFLAFICLIFISNKSLSQQDLQITLLDESCDTLVVKTWVWFSFGYQGTCPQLTSFETVHASDTMLLKLYYNISGFWPQVGCQREDTITAAILPGVTNLKGVAYSIFDNDTTAKSTTQLPICSITGTGTVSRDPVSLIFPNPSSSQFNFHVPYHRQVTITLYDLLGHQRVQQTFSKSVTINAAFLPAGVYIYELRDDRGIVENGKIVRQ